MATTITSECINCGACEPECPNTAIYAGGVPWELNGTPGAAIAQDIYYIVPSKCTECVGFHDHEACAAVCPVDCCIPDPANLESEGVLLQRARELHPETTFPDDAPSRFRKEGGAPAPAARWRRGGDQWRRSRGQACAGGSSKAGSGRTCAGGAGGGGGTRDDASAERYRRAPRPGRREAFPRRTRCRLRRGACVRRCVPDSHGARTGDGRVSTRRAGARRDARRREGRPRACGRQHRRIFATALDRAQHDPQPDSLSRATDCVCALQCSATDSFRKTAADGSCSAYCSPRARPRGVCARV